MNKSFIDIKIQVNEFFQDHEYTEEERKSIIKQSLYKKKKSNLNENNPKKNLIKQSILKIRDALISKDKNEEEIISKLEENDNKFRLLEKELPYIEEKNEYKIRLLETEKKSDEIDDEEYKKYEEMSEYEVDSMYIIFFLVLTLASSICFAVGLLFFFHTYLISKGETTLDFFKRRTMEPSLMLVFILYIFIILRIFIIFDLRIFLSFIFLM